jgi:phage tail sheath gpL-like
MADDSIGFNYIPGQGLVAPLFAFEVNSGGQPNPQNRFVIFGHALSTSQLAVNKPSTPVPCASQVACDGMCGSGSMLREMFRIAMQNSPVLPVWICAIPETGSKQVWTATLTSWAGIGVAAVEIMGELIQVSVGASDTPTTIAAALAAAINSYMNSLTGAELPITATSAAGVIAITANHAGIIFDDLDFYIPTSYQGNVLAQSGIWTLATGTAGAGVPTLTTALANLGDQPADVIVSPWSDSVSTEAYTNTTNDTSGRWAWSRQSYGHVWADATGSFSSLTTLGLTMNDRHLTLIGRITGTPTPAYLNVCARAALEAEWLFDCTEGNVSRNQTGRVIQGVLPPRNISLLWNYNARNTLTSSGISTFQVNAAGNVVIDKTVTTYQFGPLGQPDSVFRDVQALYQCSGGLTYIRSVLATEQGQKAIANTNPGSLAAITTTKDITATFIHAYSQLCSNGVFDDLGTFSGLLVVQRDTSNPDRVNVYCPMERVDPLDIIAANATIYSAYPQAA